MEDSAPYIVSSFYKFSRLPSERLPSLKQELSGSGASLALRGLVLLSTEGTNGTIAGSAENVQLFKSEMHTLLAIDQVSYKDYPCHFLPFRRFKVDLRAELVTTHRSDLFPGSDKNHHLSPAEWQQVLSSEEDLVLIDTRNDFESKLGSFKGALLPPIKSFAEFPEYLAGLNLPKDKKVMIYCTGGIRCEKAMLMFQEQGYQNTYQLEGGILKYLEQFPDSEYQGECFVFDHRVAVDQKLQPSKKFKLCPHCGNPGTLTINCRKCLTSAIICLECEKDENRVSCSKNCAHHLAFHGNGQPRRGPGLGSSESQSA